MSILDFILLIILFGFTFAGFWFGLIHSIGALVGTVAGVIVAGNYFVWLGSIIQPILMHNENLAKIIAFILLFLIVNRLVGFIFWIIGKVFNVLTVLPFLKTINRLSGAVLGLVEGILVLGIVLVMIGKFPFSSYIIPTMDTSQVAKFLVNAGKILMPLLPDVIEYTKSYLPF